MKSSKQLCLLLLTLVCLMASQLSCEQRSIDPARSPIVQQKHDFILAVVMDLSGSFHHRMFGDNARGYHFFLEVSETFFRDRMGEQDQLLLAQISGSNKGLLWQGDPMDLRRSFPSANAFKEFLEKNSDPAGSRVHDSIGQTLTYLSGLPGVSDDTQLLVVVLSDLLDTTPDSEDSVRAVRQALAEYGRRDRAAIALFWVDQTLGPVWTELLRESGIEHYTVESEIVEHPTLPTFD